MHPVVYHALDVAACVDALLDARPQLLLRAAALLGLPDVEATRQVLVTLAALHDLGKFAPAFQVKVPEHWPTGSLGPCDPARVIPGRHTDDGHVLWQGTLAPRVAAQLWPRGGAVLRVLAPAVFGHHGNPVGGGIPRLPEQRFGAALSDALACADALLALLSPTPIRAGAPDVEIARVASWWVAGLMTTADWVGSGQRWFRYTAPRADDPTLAAYWSHARTTARTAIRASGLVAPAVAAQRSFAELLDTPWQPSPAQAWADAVPLPDGPALFVLEDVTGAGKTEAAHVLVHRLMASGRAAGAYWAMPTQATANAMYARQGRVFERLYADAADPRPSLVLAHGQQRLHDEFRATVLDGVADAASSGTGLGTGASLDRAGDGPGTATCAAFLADDRRAALLADVGAGTVDQALLGVLNSRFNTVRLFALSDRVLVIDEAHAYDAYMAVELAELLRFHAALGGSAVVLSATLSHRQRARMARAWVEGLQFGSFPAPAIEDGTTFVTSQAYPLATVVAGAGVAETPVAAAPWSRREVGVRFVHDVEAACAHVVDAARAGGAVAWVRNTVDDCLAAAELLRAAGLDPIVFHARFAQADRQTREREVMALFGKAADPAARVGRVLVATQVVEQSLDLDFDAMVSDVAPVDLLVQRAGRLWRHERSRPVGCMRELVVLAPEPTPEPTQEWLGGPFEGTAHVYAHAGVLWRTVGALASTQKIVAPGGLRALIEDVYGRDDVPDALLPAAQRAEGKELSDASTATYATLKVPVGYDASQSAWLSDLRVPTRLGDEQTAVRLARVRGGRLEPWAEADAPWKAWALSEVRVRRTRVPPDATVPPNFAAAAEAVRATWGRFERELPVLPLEEEVPGLWRGELLRPGKGSIRITYTAATGLAFDARSRDARDNGAAAPTTP